MTCVLALVAGLPGAVLAQGKGNVLRDQEKATLLHFCEQMDQTAEHTVQGIRDRTDCWKRMQLEGMNDSLVESRYRAAVGDYDNAVRSDSVRLATDSTAAGIEQRLAAVQREMQQHEYVAALAGANAILRQQPDNQRALAFRDRAAALARADRWRRTLYLVGGAIVLLALLLGLGSTWLSHRHGQRVVRRSALAARQQAVVEIVDGVGRGKMYTIDGPVFRIGSAESDRPEEKNHLILSDADAFISRYHCAIVRKHGKFFLIDSSLNGTYIDDELMQRGEHRELQDGAEFSLSGVARIKFLMI